MDEYIKEYINNLVRVNDCAQNTVLSYNRDIVGFCRYLKQNGIERIELVNKTNVISYVYEMQKNNRATTTIARALTSIRNFSLFLVLKGVMIENPCDGVEIPKVERKKPEFLSPDEISLLMEQPANDKKGIRDSAMLELLYATGIRVSELVSLKLSDINLEMEFISCGVANKPRIVPIGSKAVRAVKKYLELSRGEIVKENDTKLLFVNASGNPLSRQGFWKIIKGYARSSEIEKEITPAVLRHSFAVHMIENGADLGSVSEMLGHSDIASTMKYKNLKALKLKDVYNKTHPRA